MRAICISYETAIMAMDVHALSGNFIDPELIDKDKKHV